MRVGEKIKHSKLLSTIHDVLWIRIKVHLLNEDYAHVPKMRDFTKDLKEKIWGKSKFSSLRGVLETSYHSTTLQEVGVLPTLV